jgi:hypothetical protein
MPLEAVREKGRERDRHVDKNAKSRVEFKGTRTCPIFPDVILDR